MTSHALLMVWHGPKGIPTRRPARSRWRAWWGNQGATSRRRRTSSPSFRAKWRRTRRWGEWCSSTASHGHLPARSSGRSSSRSCVQRHAKCMEEQSYKLGQQQPQTDGGLLRAFIITFQGWWWIKVTCIRGVRRSVYHLKFNLRYNMYTYTIGLSPWLAFWVFLLCCFMGSYQLNFVQSGICNEIDQDALQELKAIQHAVILKRNY